MNDWNVWIRAGVRFAGALGGVALLLAACAYESQDRRVAHAQMASVLPVKAQNSVAPPPTVQDEVLFTPLRARIDVNPAQNAPDDPVAQEAAFSAWNGFAARDGRVDGRQWAQLPAPRVSTALLLPPSLPSRALEVYAARTSCGVTLALANQSGQPIETNTLLHLPRGVYQIERLTLTPPQPPVNGVIHTGQTDMLPDLSPETLALKLERLEGCDLAGTKSVAKRYTLLPGQSCLYRITDRTRSVRQALSDTYGQLHRLALTNPGPARRLRRMLREGDSAVGGLRAGSLNRRLECIHHLLLLAAQAQSLHHNLQNRQVLNAETGEAVMAALDRLTDSLSETSATLLDLIPQVTVTNPPAITSKPSVDTRPNTPTERIVTVALANDGSQTVRNVKLGLNFTALPGGVTCQPLDPAYFDALRPGQTARAEFRLQGVNAMLPALRGVSDVSYFTAGTPAHLRPSAW